MKIYCCPYCGNQKCIVQRAGRVKLPEMTDLFHVYCDQCHANGGLQDTKAKAVYAHNKISELNSSFQKYSFSDFFNEREVSKNRKKLDKEK